MSGPTWGAATSAAPNAIQTATISGPAQGEGGLAAEGAAEASAAGEVRAVLRNRWKIALTVWAIRVGLSPMDDLDQHLLDKLRANARAPVAELARSLGLSRTTIQTRPAKLERSGVIAGYCVKLSQDRAGALVRAHVMLSVDARAAGEVAEALRRMAGVLRLQSVSGPFDMIAEVEGQGVEGLDALVLNIAALRGVERATKAVVLATRFDR